jgi:hypothetical protein
MSVVTARGKAAKENATKQNHNIDFKKVFIRLKDGESVRVRVLSDIDYVEYYAHGSYAKGIYTQPCIEPKGEQCALCEAAKYEGEVDDQGNPVWKQLGRRKRYVFAFADIDSGEIRVFDASKGQAQGLIAQIDEYAENLEEVAFTFKRVGAKKETSYTLNPILKLKKDDQEKFHKFDKVGVEDDFFDAVLQARTRDKQIEELTKAGFPVAEVFGITPAPKNEEAPNKEPEPITEEELDPEKVF